MRCFDLYSAAAVWAGSFSPHPPQAVPLPLKGKAKALSPARKQKISSLCSEIFGKNPSNAKHSPFLRKVPGFFRPERSESIFC